METLANVVVGLMVILVVVALGAALLVVRNLLIALYFQFLSALAWLLRWRHAGLFFRLTFSPDHRGEP